MHAFAEEITQKRTMSAKDCCILKVGEVLKNDSAVLTDLCCTLVKDEIVCFMSFNSGQICIFSFTHSKLNKAFRVSEFRKTEVFLRATTEADQDYSDSPAKVITCLDFIESQSE